MCVERHSADLAEGFYMVPDAALKAGFRVEILMPTVGVADIEVRGRLKDGSTPFVGSVSVRRSWRASADPSLRRSVSVVIRLLTTRSFLPDAIESVLAQTHRDVEIVVVDDGSTDNASAVDAGTRASGASARRFVDSRKPATPACGESNGDFLVFLDSDDTLPAPACLGDRRAIHGGAPCGRVRVRARHAHDRGPVEAA